MKDKLSVKEYEDPFKGQLVVRCPLKGSDESRAQWLEQSESQRLQALAGNGPLQGRANHANYVFLKQEINIKLGYDAPYIYMKKVFDQCQTKQLVY